MWLIRLIKGVADWCAGEGSFTITLLAMGIALTLSLKKDCDINTLLPTIVGLYLGHKTTKDVSGHWSQRGQTTTEIVETEQTAAIDVKTDTK